MPKDRSAWKTDDAAWVKARKAQWKDIKQRLDGVGCVNNPFGFIKKSDQKCLKSYFLTGLCADEFGDSIRKHEPHFVNPNYDPDNPLRGIEARVLFELWLHPDTSEANWEQIFESRIIPGTRETHWHFAQTRFMGTLGNYPPEGSLYGSAELDERLYAHFCRRDGLYEPIRVRAHAGCLISVMKAFFGYYPIPTTDSHTAPIYYAAGDPNGLASRVVIDYVRVAPKATDEYRSNPDAHPVGYHRKVVSWALVALAIPETYSEKHLEVARQLMTLIEAGNDYSAFVEEDIAVGRALAKEQLAERERLLEAVEKSGGLKKKAAAEFGISVRKLREYLTKHRIEWPA